MTSKVVIIGAGPAGLTAGLELIKNNKEYEVIILEKTNRIGGISTTVDYKGNKMDLGGHRFFSKNQKIVEMWKSFLPIQNKPSKDDILLNISKELPTIGTNPEKEDNSLLIRRRVSRIYCWRKFFDYPISINLKTFKNMGIIKTIISGFSYIKSTLLKKEENSLENFYINRFGKYLYTLFFENYTEKLWGRHPRNISAEWGAQRVKGLSIFGIFKDKLSKLFLGKKRKVETSLIEEFYYPKFGPGQLFNEMAIKFEKLGGKIIKNACVKNIESNGNKVTKIYFEKDGKMEIIETEAIFSSMPIKDLITGFNMGNVDSNILRIASGLPYRDFITIGILLKQMKLVNETKLKTINNIVPDCWIYVQDSKVKLGRIQIFNNWSPYMVKDIENTVWLGLEYFCNENDDFWNLDEETRINLAINELISMGIIYSKEDVLDYHIEKVQKAYPAYFDTYSEFDILKNFLNSYENLYCIGRNGQHKYNNMDHSMLTAIESVQNFKTGITTKENIWNVNTEKEYHESKSN